MLATLSTALPAGDEWTFEEKYDGIRALAYREAGAVRLWSRNDLDLTAGFPDAVAAIGALGDGDLVLDGELVVFDRKGVSRFQLLQRRGSGGQSVFVAFDLLVADGRSILRRPFAERRGRLEALLGGQETAALRLSRRVALSGERAYAAARRKGWEGIIAKDGSALYAPGVRSRSWLKIKVRKESEFVIGGFTPPAGGREHLGALLVGLFDGPKLRYCGKVGSGYTRESLADLAHRLRSIRVARSPFVDAPGSSDVRWVRPALVAQVAFAEWTVGDKLRQPVFLGLRRDKKPRECRWAERER